MRKTILWVLGGFASLLIIGSISNVFRIEDEALSQPWQEFKSGEFNFVVQIPAQNIAENDINSPILFTKGKSFETESYRCSYRVEAFKLPSNLTGSSSDSLLNQIADSSLKNITGGVITGTKDLDSFISAPYGDKGMRVVNYGWGQHPVNGRVRIDNSFAYNLSYICQDYDAHNKSIRAKFFDSFQSLNSNI